MPKAREGREVEREYQGAVARCPVEEPSLGRDCRPGIVVPDRIPAGCSRWIGCIAASERYRSSSLPERMATAIWPAVCPAASIAEDAGDDLGFAAEQLHLVPKRQQVRPGPLPEERREARQDGLVGPVVPLVAEHDIARVREGQVAIRIDVAADMVWVAVSEDHDVDLTGLDPGTSQVAVQLANVGRLSPAPVSIRTRFESVRMTRPLYGDGMLSGSSLQGACQ